MFGASLFIDFARSAERIPRNILAERLRRLETAGLIRREVYQDRPLRHRYRLTAAGADFLPVIEALEEWGARHLGHTYDPPDSLRALTAERLVGPGRDPPARSG